MVAGCQLAPVFVSGVVELVVTIVDPMVRSTGLRIEVANYMVQYWEMAPASVLAGRSEFEMP